MCVCVYVCVSKQKKVLNRFEKIFFPRKVWTQGVTWAISEVSNTTPSCRKPENRQKRGFSDLEDSIAIIYWLISTNIGTMVPCPLLHLKKNLKTRSGGKRSRAERICNICNLK